MSADALADAFIAWAKREPSIAALVLIGSRSRAVGEVSAADRFSDWDFQVVTSRPELFADRGWLRAAGLPEPLACVVRTGRLGRTGRGTAIFTEGELDCVLLPAGKLRLARWAFALGLGERLTRNPALGDLALVLRPGHRVIKGGPGWETFFRRVATEVPLPRLDDRAVAELADGFVCDCVSTLQKIDRGELIAAQRWLHAQLVETNFRLIHELRLRRGETSFPDARRIESLRDPVLVAALAVRATPDRESLVQAVEHSAQTCRAAVAALVGNAWHWPEGLTLRLRRE